MCFKYNVARMAVPPAAFGERLKLENRRHSISLIRNRGHYLTKTTHILHHHLDALGARIKMSPFVTLALVWKLVPTYRMLWRISRFDWNFFVFNTDLIGKVYATRLVLSYDLIVCGTCASVCFTMLARRYDALIDYSCDCRSLLLTDSIRVICCHGDCCSIRVWTYQYWCIPRLLWLAVLPVQAKTPGLYPV